MSSIAMLRETFEPRMATNEIWNDKRKNPNIIVYIESCVCIHGRWFHRENLGYFPRYKFQKVPENYPIVRNRMPCSEKTFYSLNRQRYLDYV